QKEHATGCRGMKVPPELWPAAVLSTGRSKTPSRTRATHAIVRLASFRFYTYDLRGWSHKPSEANAPKQYPVLRSCRGSRTRNPAAGVEFDPKQSARHACRQIVGGQHRMDAWHGTRREWHRGSGSWRERTGCARSTRVARPQA